MEEGNRQENGLVKLFRKLAEEIVAAIDNDALADDDAFNRLAMRVFDFQSTQNSFYSAYIDAVGTRSPDNWSQIPPVPTAAFKRASVRSFPEEQTLTFFQTSGTTEQESGRHYFNTLELYERAIVPNFKNHLLPHVPTMRMVFLSSSPSEMPHSSLIHMFGVVRNCFGEPGSDFYGAGSELQYDRLLEDLGTAGEPVFLFATAFAFVFLVEEMRRRGTFLKLPQGSRIMETGGFKGQTREVERLELYRMLSNSLGVPFNHIVNEYGMTELSSQFYDATLVTGNATNHKTHPSWTRVLIVNPATGKPMPRGEVGAIQILDLANLGSVIAIQTEDAGIEHEDGFEILGRLPRAEMRGCSLQVN